MQCVNDNMHTHSQVKLQSGAEIMAITKPEKEDTTSDAARSNIWCLAALWVEKIEPLREPAGGRLFDERLSKYRKDCALASN